MSTETQNRRTEMLAEYYKLIDMLQDYDKHFLSIKNWSVTLSGAAVGFAFVGSSTPSFLIAFILALGFWLTDVRFKLLQLGHITRTSELEKALSNDAEIPTPQILTSYGRKADQDIRSRRWLSVLFWPQVMLPHVFFVVLSAVAGIIQLLRP